MKYLNKTEEQLHKFINTPAGQLTFELFKLQLEMERHAQRLSEVITTFNKSVKTK